MTTATNATRLPTYNQCRYAYVNAQGNCRSDRNCADCLQQKGCRIGAGGFCEPDADLTDPQADALNYKQGLVVGNVSLPSDKINATAMQTWHFSASQVTYCSGDDAVCNRCSAENYGVGRDVDDSRFCVGMGGCVCVLNCKSSFLERAYCDSDRSRHGAAGSIDGAIGTMNPVPAKQVTETNSKTTRAAMWVVLSVVVVLVGLALAFVWRRMRTRRSANQSRRADSEYALQHTPGITSGQAKTV